MVASRVKSSFECFLGSFKFEIGNWKGVSFSGKFKVKSRLKRW